MLRPQHTKFRKHKKIRIRRIEQRQTKLNFGDVGLKSLEGGQVTSRQIEAVRRVITRKLKRTGRLWIRIFPNIPVTKKPVEVRMGKGKGAVDRWVAVVKPGTVLYEIGNVKPTLAHQAFLAAAKKLPMKCSIIHRD